MRLLRKIIFVVFALTFLVQGEQAFAASLSVVAPSTAGVSQGFDVAIYLDTKGATINAFDGTVLLPSFLEGKMVRDGNTITSLWIEKPELLSNKVHFAGIIPGGFSGKGFLFSVSVTAKTKGQSTISLADAHALLNDGKGTAVPLSLLSSVVSIGSEAKNIPTLYDVSTDHVSPEGFVPFITQDPSLSGGKIVAVFQAVDKASGINHYDIAEKRGFKTTKYDTLSWQEVTSPYVLRDQSRESFIYVRAVDQNKNVRIQVLSPAHTPLYYNGFFYLAILILILVLFVGTRVYASRARSKT